MLPCGLFVIMIIILGEATEIFMDEQAGCRDFKMDIKSNSTMIKVKKEAGGNIAIYLVKVMLEDGRDYRAFMRNEQNETLAESFPLRIQRKSRKLAMYLNYKQVNPNTEKIEYINQTKVELKLNDRMNHSSCQTNPLPWPEETKDKTIVLEDLKFLGTCFTFDLVNIRDLQAKYTGPKKGEFIVTKILLKSTELQIQASEWRSMSQRSGLSEDKWFPLFFDEG